MFTVDKLSAPMMVGTLTMSPAKLHELIAGTRSILRHRLSDLKSARSLEVGRLLKSRTGDYS